MSLCNSCHKEIAHGNSSTTIPLCQCGLSYHAAQYSKIKELEAENKHLTEMLYFTKNDADLWCVWDKRNKQVFWSHPRLHGGEDACKKYISLCSIPDWLEVRKLVAVPSIAEKG